jgi:hypothetical protein
MLKDMLELHNGEFQLFAGRFEGIILHRLLGLGVGALLSLGVVTSAGAVAVLPMYTQTVAPSGSNSFGPVWPQNPVTYSFTATVTGHVMAYYTGSTASDAEWIGLLTGPDLAHLTDSGVFGLENHSTVSPFTATPLGTALDFGLVQAGTTLVFYIQDLNPGRSANRFYSDAAMNLDGAGGAAVQHIYSTAFNVGADGLVSTGGASPQTFAVPTGAYTYVGFEDLPATDPFHDFNYHDETFIFTDVSTNAPTTSPLIPTGGVPEPSAWALMLLGFGGLGASLRHNRARGLAAA